MKPRKRLKDNILTINSKIKAYTLSEVLIVLILTTIVVSISFSILNLVHKQFYSIKGNLNETTKLQFVSTRFKLELDKHEDIILDPSKNKISFISPIDTSYVYLNKEYLLFANDSLKMPRITYFKKGSKVSSGPIDAIKMEFDKKSLTNVIFISKSQDASQLMR